MGASLGVRSLALIGFLTCVSLAARAATGGETSGTPVEDEEVPRVTRPELAPVTPPTPHIALAVVIRYASGLGFDFSFYPLERLEIGFSLASCLFFSEVGLYARYAVVHRGADDFDLGLRWQGLAALTLDDDDANPGHEQVSVEAGYEHRFGSNLFGVDLEGAVRRDGRWFPFDPLSVSGGIRLGHFW